MTLILSLLGHRQASLSHELSVNCVGRLLFNILRTIFVQKCSKLEYFYLNFLKSLHFVFIFHQALKMVYYADRLFVRSFQPGFLPVDTVRSLCQLRIKVFATIVSYHSEIQQCKVKRRSVIVIVIVVLNVIKVSCCGLCALLERSKVGDADIYLIILPMHLMQGTDSYTSNLPLFLPFF